MYLLWHQPYHRPPPLQSPTSQNPFPKSNDVDYCPSEFLNTHYKLDAGRKFIANTGGVWAADSPRGSFDVM
jgi:hypothetical protein